MRKSKEKYEKWFVKERKRQAERKRKINRIIIHFSFVQFFFGFLSFSDHLRVSCDVFSAETVKYLCVHIARLTHSFSIPHIFKYSFHLHQTHFSTFYFDCVSHIFLWFVHIFSSSYQGTFGQFHFSSSFQATFLVHVRKTQNINEFRKSHSKPSYFLHIVYDLCSYRVVVWCVKRIV